MSENTFTGAICAHCKKPLGPEISYLINAGKGKNGRSLLVHEPCAKTLVHSGQLPMPCRIHPRIPAQPMDGEGL